MPSGPKFTGRPASRGGASRGHRLRSTAASGDWGRPGGRLAAFTDGATTTTWGWDTVLNRTSVQAGTDPAVTTSYDPANRLLTDSLGGVYASDDDGRLTARPDATGAPSQQMTWDNLGRLTSVRNGDGTATLAAYTYDPLDRLRVVDYGSGNRIRFRYAGLTTSAVQTIDDATGTVIRNIGTGWGGELLEDWTGSGSDLRIFGTNAHHDLTWTADSTGAVTGSVRYDPAGVATSVTGSVPDFRFQGSWADDVTRLSWVVTRWYAPAQGRFISEDSLTGEPRDPDSRHLYAYGAGDPVGAWDPSGTTTMTTSVLTAAAFARYFAVLDYMYREMIQNAKGSRPGQFRGEPGHLRCVMVCWIEGNTSLSDARVLGDFLALVHGPVDAGKIRIVDPGAWDHKPKLRTLVGINRVFFTPIAGDPIPEQIKYDVWSNIHYGYVGRAHGIPEGLLLAAQSGGAGAEGDTVSVFIGLQLWRDHRLSLSKRDVQSAILRWMPVYRHLPGSVKPGWF